MAEQYEIGLFLILLFVVAFLYSSVGHGGASGYLALMALFGFSAVVMKPSALVLNIFVSIISFAQYYRAGYFKWELFWPFAITSVPASLLGAYITLDSLVYKRILGVLLIFPALRILGLIGKENSTTTAVSLAWAMIIGGMIGLVSGMIGIGGGILLSPAILLLNWGNMKETAAVSALFIFVNSLSGMAGLLSRGLEIDPQIYLWVFVAAAGGLTGAYFGSKSFSKAALKISLASVLIIACVKLLTAAYT